MAKKDDEQILSRNQVLALLSQKAADGSVTAQVALEQALRHQDEPKDELDKELDRMLESHRREN